MRYPNEARLFACARCAAQNRVPLERALTRPDALRCGACREPILVGKDEAIRDPRGGDPVSRYAHALDRDALAAVQQIPGADTLLKKLIEHTYERYDRLFHQASYVLAGDGQLPTLRRLFDEAAHRLGVDESPDLFLYTDPVPNAHCGGVERPYVAVSTGLVDMMEDDEVFAVMAHELSHWQCRHVLYKTATQLLIGAASALATATLGLGNLIAMPVKLALLNWDRCSELTADRGMLLATRDVNLCMRVLFKLAGGSTRLRHELSLDKFLEQAVRARLSHGDGILDRAFSLLQTLYRTHPFPLWRAQELWTWACEGEYLDLLRREPRPYGLT